MAQTIKLKRSAQAGNTPALNQLELGEIAINTADGKMFIKRDDGTSNDPTIVEVGSTGSFLPLSGGTLTGNLSLGDNVKAQFGASNDLQIYHDGSNSIINDAGTGTIRIQTAGANQWEFNGLNFKGNDGRKIILGDSSDLQIYHDGSNSYIDEQGTGSLNIRSSTTLRLQNASGDNYLYGTNNGEVVLYHNNSPKLATTSTGIDVTGSVTADGLTVSNNSGATLNINTAGGATDAKILLHETATATSEYGASLKYDGAYNRFEIGVGQDPETKRLSIDRDTGDISFYNSAGTSQSFYWDSSTSRLGLGTTAPSQALEIKRSGNNGNVALKIHNTGTATNDDALIGFLTEGNRNYSLGIHRDSGSFTLSNQDASVASGELLTIANSGNATFSGSVTANAGLAVDNITIDGNEIDLSSGDLTLDVAGKINLDHGSPEILLKDDGTHYASFISSNTDFVIQSILSDKDMLFKGQDGSSTITALTLDMSNSGSASFSNNVNIPNGGLMVGATTAPTSANSNGQTLVLSGSGNTGMSIVSGTSSNSSIMFADGYGGTAGYRGHIKYNHADDSLNFATAATANRLTIDSSGSVGIGVTPSAKVHIDGATSSGLLKLDVNAGVTGNILFRKDDSRSTSLVEWTIQHKNDNQDFIIYGYDGTTFKNLIEYDWSASTTKLGSGNVNIGSSLMVGSTTAPTGNFNSYISATRQITHNGNGGDLSVISDNNSSPVFYVKGTGNADLVNVFDNTTEVFKIADGGNASFSGAVLDVENSSGAMMMVDDTNGRFIKIRSANSGSQNANISSYSGLYLGGSDNASHVVIDNQGRVNIGSSLMVGATTAPSAPLDVVTNSTVYAAEFTQSNTSNGDGVFISVGSTAAADYALTVRSDAGNTSVLAAKADGKVGIGTFTPSETLHLKSANPVIRLEDSNPNGIYAQIDGAGGSLILSADQGNGSANSSIVFKNDNTERMRIDSSGSVGIGVSPSANSSYMVALQLGEQANLYAHTDGVGAGSATYLSNNITHNSGFKYINADAGSQYTQASGAHKWSSFASGSAGGAATENTRMTLTSVGDLLLGKTSSAFGTDGIELQATDNVWITKTGGNPLGLNRKGSDGSIIELYKDTGSLVGSIASLSGDILIGTGNTGLRFYDAGKAIQPRNTDGSTARGSDAISLGMSDDPFADLYLSGTANTAHVNVGGGTVADPTVTIDSASGGDPTLVFDTGATNRSAIIRFKDQGTTSGFINYHHQYDRMDFGSGSSTGIGMSLTSGGTLLVGTTGGATYQSTVNEGVEIAPDFIGVARNQNTVMHLNRQGNDGTIVDFRTYGFVRGSVSISGSTTSYNTSSDKRLKDNIVDAPTASEDIDAIQVRSFDWKADGEHQKYGMVAQELLEVAPDAVTKGDTPDDMMGVDYSKLVPMLIKEIQSLRQRVAQLEE